MLLPAMLVAALMNKSLAQLSVGENMSWLLAYRPKGIVGITVVVEDDLHVKRAFHGLTRIQQRLCNVGFYEPVSQCHEVFLPFFAANTTLGNMMISGSKQESEKNALYMLCYGGGPHHARFNL